MPASSVTAAITTAVIAAIGLGVTGCDSGATGTATIAAAAPADSHVLFVDGTSCIGSWPATTAGPHTFSVANHGTQTVQVSFINASTGAIFGQIFQLDPGTSRPLQVDPPAGSYRFRCIPRRGVASVSPTGRVRGNGGSMSSALSPLSAEEIVTAVSTYRHGVRVGIDRLTRDTASLATAVHHGDWNAAKQRWLIAHLDFATLGAAYGTFGALSARIDGRADGLPNGVNDTGFTGFLAVERLLWHHAPHAETVVATDALQADVTRLQERFPHLTLVAGDLPLRAHEILENALQFELTGDTDEGSHTNLATVLANVRGTQLVIRALAPALLQRRPDLLDQITAQLANTAHELQSLRARASNWPAVTALSQRQREDVDAAIDNDLEKLALLPGVLTLPVSLALP